MDDPAERNPTSAEPAAIAVTEPGVRAAAGDVRRRGLRLTRMQRYEAWRARRIGERGVLRALWRAGVAMVGSLLVVGGLALVPLPGPGWVIVFVGLGVLATEFTWADHALRRVRWMVHVWSAWVRTRSGAVRAAVGVACLFGVVTALVGLTWLVGTPSWVPDGLPLVR